ncbi:MAG TPA: rhomboid family intramembrane serine protease, partial [Odoribacter splanchnicus]|nr:rhomboid family intramembrane serine protease [Odoribacter splanchnicus]
AIVFAVCTYLPQHKVYIFLLGPVKLVYLALFTALIDIMSISSGNAGGHIAHLGG